MVNCKVISDEVASTSEPLASVLSLYLACICLYTWTSHGAVLISVETLIAPASLLNPPVAAGLRAALPRRSASPYRRLQVKVLSCIQM